MTETTDRTKKVGTGEASLSVALNRRDLTLKTAKPEQIVSIVRGLVKDSEEAKEAFWVPLWLRLMYYFMGYMHLNWSEGRKRYYPVDLGEDERVTVNMMMGRVLTIASRLIKSKPTFDTIPVAADADAREQARLALKVLRYVWHESESLPKTILGALHRALFGIAFEKVVWDPHKKIQPPQPIPVTDPMTGQQRQDEMGRPMFVRDGNGRIKMERPDPLGEAAIFLRTCFDMHFPPSAQMALASNWAWAAEKIAMPVGEAQSRWGGKYEPDSLAIDVAGQIGHDLGHFFAAGTTQFSEPRAKDSIWTIEYHEGPSRFEGFEQGIRLTIADEELVEDPMPSELREGRIPYFAYPLVPCTFAPWGLTPAMNMMEPNMHYNVARGCLSKMSKRLAMPHWVATVDSISGDTTTEGNRIMEVESGAERPELIRMPGIDSGTIAALKASQEDIGQAGSISSVSMGQPLGASPQPVGTIQLLQEADVGDLALGIMFGTESRAREGEALLDIVYMHYDKSRVGFLIGDNEDIDIFEFSQLTVPPGIRVRVQTASALPHIKEAQQQKFAQMASSGFFNSMLQDPAQAEKFMSGAMEIMDMPTPEPLESLADIHKKKQEREIRDIIRMPPQQQQGPPGPDGQPQGPQALPLGPMDNHEAHMAVIERFVNVSGWEGLQPHQQQGILAHKELHSQAIMEQQIQAMKQQLMMAQAQAQIQAVAAGGNDAKEQASKGSSEKSASKS